MVHSQYSEFESYLPPSGAIEPEEPSWANEVPSLLTRPGGPDTVETTAQTNILGEEWLDQTERNVDSAPFMQHASKQDIATSMQHASKQDIATSMQHASMQGATPQAFAVLEKTAKIHRLRPPPPPVLAAPSRPKAFANPNQARKSLRRNATATPPTRLTIDAPRFAVQSARIDTVVFRQTVQFERGLGVHARWHSFFWMAIFGLSAGAAAALFSWGN